MSLEEIINILVTNSFFKPNVVHGEIADTSDESKLYLYSQLKTARQLERIANVLEAWAKNGIPVEDVNR